MYSKCAMWSKKRKEKKPFVEQQVPKSCCKSWSRNPILEESRMGRGHREGERENSMYHIMGRLALPGGGIDSSLFRLYFFFIVH